MNDTIYSIFLIIQNEIQKHYSSLRISLSQDVDDNEYYISIDNRKIFHSKEYRKLIFDITENILWKVGIYNVFFNIEMIEVIDNVVFNNSIDKSNTQYQTNDIQSDFDLKDTNILDNNEIKLLQLAA